MNLFLSNVVLLPQEKRTFEEVTCQAEHFLKEGLSRAPGTLRIIDATGEK